jgi:hypothetical protein
MGVVLAVELDMDEGQAPASDLQGCEVKNAPPPAVEGKARKRKKPRRKRANSDGESWESTRKAAWLRELLSSSSEDEEEDKYAKFEESSRWVAEIGGHGTGAKAETKGRGVGPDA